MTTVSRADASAAQISMAVLHTLLKDLHPRDFSVRLWDGSTWDPEPGQPSRFTMAIRRPGALRAMFLAGSERTLGEAYAHNDFDIEGRLEDAFPMADYLLGLRPSGPEKLGLAAQLLRLPAEKRPGLGRQAAKLKGEMHSEERDREAVRYHYDTSNEFFALFLGREMVYSCGYFASPDEDLDTAQERKLDYICRKLRLRKGDTLLDIGCGWGGLVIHAAKHHGVSALGVTLSEPQAQLAAERIAKAGLMDRCRVEVRDYRHAGEDGSFDAIASIGMVEHVGAEKLPEYFRHAQRLLRPGGVFLNHGIAPRPGHGADRKASFTQAYVFPDSEPVPIGRTTQAAEEAGLEVRDVESLREHYAITLRHWVRRLEARREEAIRQTDETTYRIWRMYLAVAAHDFDRGLNNVYQSLLVKPDAGRSGLPLTRSDWYR